MAITYPVDFPVSFGYSTFSIGLKRVVAVSESVFTLQQKVQVHQGEAWEIQGTIDLLNREQAEEYNAWLLSLNGREGTFTTIIPGSETPRGVATGTPLINGASQTGQDIDTDGWSPSVTGILKAGDFVQVGTGLNTKLHKQLVDADSNASGEVTLTLAPEVRVAYSDNETIIVNNCKGLFRLNTNINPVAIRPPNQHSINFSAREAV